MADEFPFSSKGTQPHPVFWMKKAGPKLSVDAVPGTSAQAVISEIEACALRFAETGEETSIDLRCLKAMPEEREILSTLLGRGEVSATIQALGPSEIHETSVPCVWWVRHRNADEEIVGELIEISQIPEVMLGDRQAVVRGLKALRTASPSVVKGGTVATTHPNERELP